ncbi:MAG: asparagine--tRNA ligase [Candidatus Aenigmarchaeota archaeon]|nr:asparagine--tRNA ligase [Candidatus Aenigmarchaeota archaeon]
MEEEKFTKVEDALSKKQVGKEVNLRGWVYRHRVTKDVVFVLLRDSSGIIQCTFKKGDVPEDVYDKAEQLKIESSVKIKGVVREDKRAPGGFEIEGKDLEIVHLAERFPIGRDLSEEFLLDVRHLWIRSQKMINVLKIRSKVFESIHEYFRNKGFYLTHSPILTPGSAESGPDLFEVKFFDRKVYLTQTWQLYAETILPALEKIYTITPAFRAEKSRTIRHLAEYWTAEAEAAWYNLDDCIGLSEGLISYVCQKVGRECKKELKTLGRDPDYLMSIKAPFPKITYTEALKILEKDGMKVRWGKDLRTNEERQLMTHYDKPLVVSHYPKDIMAFYKPRDPNNPKVALCYDILSPEIGIEIVGGSERDLNIEEMKKALKKAGEDPKKYEFYFDTRRYGAVPHSGFGLGIERLIMWICKLDHIRDAIPFPRTFRRCNP